MYNKYCRSLALLIFIVGYEAFCCEGVKAVSHIFFLYVYGGIGGTASVSLVEAPLLQETINAKKIGKQRESVPSFIMFVFKSIMKEKAFYCLNPRSFPSGY